MGIRSAGHGMAACCPPMFLKIMGCLQDYIYGSARGSFYVNLHMGSRYEGSLELKDGSVLKLAVEQKDCGLPWDGRNSIVVHPESGGLCTGSARSRLGGKNRNPGERG